MSIIHEALQKASTSKKKSNQVKSVDLEFSQSNESNYTGKAAAAAHIPIIKINTLFLPITIVCVVIIFGTFFLLKNGVIMPKIPSMNIHETILKTKSEKAVKALTPPKPSASSDEKYTLYGIAYEENQPLAIINDSVYASGEKVGEAIVVAITRNRVILDESGRVFELEVN